MSRQPSKKVRHQTAEQTSALADALASNQRLVRLLGERMRDHENWQIERERWAEERRLFRAMIDQVPDYLFVKDTRCRFVIANRSVAADLGSNPDDILGKTDLELHPAELASEFYADDQRVLDSGTPMLDHEEYVLLPSGERRWLSTSKLPLRDAAGVTVGLVGIARDITHRKEAEERIRHLAYHDQLTGLPNRAEFESKLADVAQGGRPAFLLLVDLDRFKQVNDTLGHAAGDELLRVVGQRLVRLVAPSGFVARLGGDEFALIVGDPVSSICDEIIRSLGAPFLLLGKVAHVGASIGVTRVRPDVSAMEALRQADIALYEAKGRGRGHWQVFKRNMAKALESRRRLEDDLREAFGVNDQIFPHYQPIYTADLKTLAGAEALARWRHPDVGFIPPAAFIPVAEEAGLIGALGERMLLEACGLLSRCDIPWIAVNVSTVQLHADDDFADRTLATVRAAGINPRRVHLEITESVLLDESGQAARILTQLRDAGIRISLDDFGTGYSSLHYLRRFAIDNLKIDRSFVADIGSPSADAIVEAVVGLARGLNLTTTAEGVETEAQRRFLHRAGCQLLQGFLMSPPVTEERLLSMVSVDT